MMADLSDGHPLADYADRLDFAMRFTLEKRGMTRTDGRLVLLVDATPK